MTESPEPAEISTALEVNDRGRVEGEFIEDRVSLLSQQVWCWGRDILRPEGNWLVEIGFGRVEPPADRKDCTSVYFLVLPHGRCVVLRGFGVFYGDVQRGGVFLPRYEFKPLYTTQATLDHPPWSRADLPELSAASDSQRTDCKSLTLDLIDWIRSYEVSIVERLGIDYRRSIMHQWENRKRPCVPAEELASAWQELSLRVAENVDGF